MARRSRGRAVHRSGQGPDFQVYRLGTLIPVAPIVPSDARAAILITGMAQRGYTLGQNLAYEARGAAGKVGERRD